MRAIVLVALLSVSTLASAQSEPFDFKGIALGSDIAAIESNSRFQCKDGKSALADRMCSLRYGEKETIAGVPIRVLLLYFYDGKLQTISILLTPENFSQVADALKEKYGEGSLKTQELHNRMGATFEDQIYSWRKPGATLRARRYSGDIESSSVLFQTDIGLEEFHRRRGSSTKERAKDL